MASPSSNTPLTALAIRQKGNVTRAQLWALGLTNRAIRHRVSTGTLHRVHADVFAVGKPPTTAHERAAAAVLACGEGAALSHSSAMVLWELWKHWTHPFEVVVPNDRRPKGIRTHYIPTLHPKDTTTQHGIRVTTAARTLLDMSRRLTDKQLTRAVNEAMHLRHLRQSHLQDLLTRHRKHPNASRLTPYLERQKTGTTRSQLEDDFLTLCRDYGLPTPLTNHYLDGHARDAYFPNHGLIVEIDSFEYHNDRHTFEQDRDRDATALQAGHPTIRITDYRMKTAPAEEAARLRKILDALEKRRLSLGSAPDPDSEPRT